MLPVSAATCRSRVRCQRDASGAKKVHRSTPTTKLATARRICNPENLAHRGPVLQTRGRPDDNAAASAWSALLYLFFWGQLFVLVVTAASSARNRSMISGCRSKRALSDAEQK